MTLPAARDLAQYGHPRQHDRPRPVRHAAACRAAGGGPPEARRRRTLSAAPGRAGRVRAAGLPHRREPDAQRRDDPAGRRVADATALSRQAHRRASSLPARERVAEPVGNTDAASASGHGLSNVGGEAASQVGIGTRRRKTAGGEARCSRWTHNVPRESRAPRRKRVAGRYGDAERAWKPISRVTPSTLQASASRSMSPEARSQMTRGLASRSPAEVRPARLRDGVHSSRRRAGPALRAARKARCSAGLRHSIAEALLRGTLRAGS